MKYYELIDHTADLGIRVSGKNLSTLFSNAGHALFDLMADNSALVADRQKELRLRADDLDELMFLWIRTLLAEFVCESWMYMHFDVSITQQRSLWALLRGHKTVMPQHLLRNDLKAITYHELHVSMRDNVWTTQLIFDV